MQFMAALEVALAAAQIRLCHRKVHNTKLWQLPAQTLFRLSAHLFTSMVYASSAAYYLHTTGGQSQRSFMYQSAAPWSCKVIGVLTRPPICLGSSGGER